MGVSVEAWRARIGSFAPRLRTQSTVSTKVGLFDGSTGDKFQLCTVAVLLYTQLLLGLLMLSGDIETNPGPAPVQSHECHICGQTFPRADTLRQHLSRHDTQENCPICKNPFSTANVLENHIISVHGKGKRPADASRISSAPKQSRIQPSTVNKACPNNQRGERKRPATTPPRTSAPKKPNSTPAARYVGLDVDSTVSTPIHTRVSEATVSTPLHPRSTEPTTSRSKEAEKSTTAASTSTASESKSTATDMPDDPWFDCYVDHLIDDDTWFLDEEWSDNIDSTAMEQVNYNIKTLSSTRNEKFNTTKSTYRVNFENINVQDPTKIIAQLGQVFENVINSIAVSSPQDLIQIAVSDPDLDYPVITNFQRPNDNIVESILAQIEKVMQSEKGLNIDSGLQIDVTHVEMPSGGVFYKNPADVKGRIENKRSIIQIKNNDNMCCARAIIVAKAKLDRHEQWNNIRQGRAIQTTLAEQLHRDADVPIGECGIDEIRKFQDVLPDYQINVISKANFDENIYSGPDQDKRIYIYNVDNHYHVISSITGFYSMPYYCNTCHKGYKTRENHRCNNPCYVCFKIHDQGPIDWVRCDDCNRYFKNQVCYDSHKRRTEKGFSTCGTYKKCDKCLKVVDRRAKDHHCGQRFCTRCKSFQLPNHQCFMQPIDLSTPHVDINTFNANGEAAQKTKKDKLQYVFLDYECTQETGVHVPNLCVSHTVCLKCLNKEPDNCSDCGVRERVFRGPTTNVDFCRWLFVEREQKKQDKRKRRKAQKKAVPKKEETIVMCHNLKGYDGYFILQYLYDNGVLPEIIYNGAKIMSIEIPALELKLIDSLNFLPMSLSKLPSMFGFNELAKGYFPHLFNTVANTDVTLPHLPDVEYYNAESMKEGDRDKFLAWYEDHKNDYFDTKRELLKYCKSDVDILRRCCLEFRRLFMNMTGTDADGKDGIDPFKQSITIASACNLVYRAKHLSAETIGLIPPDNYHPNQNQSAVALRWIKYVAHKDGIRIQHVKNGGEVKIGKYLVDGFHQPTNTVYNFHGCYWHGCTKCFSRDTVNKVNKMTMEHLYAATQETKAYIESRGYNYVEKWQCDYERELRTDADMKTYIDQLEIVSPLSPRDAFFGGRTEGFRLFHEVGADEKIKYVDFTSLYPYVNKYKKYPLGHPRLITENFNDLASYEGLVKCKIVAPQNLYLPVLPSKINDKLLFSLCRTCAEKQEHNCNHSENERAFTGTWVIEEVLKAVEKGYRVLAIYEVWHYDNVAKYDKETDSRGLFSDYIDSFLKLKQEANGWPSWCQTDDDKEQYIENYRENEGITLNRQNIAKNPGMRGLAKLMLNSFWGKFGQRSNFPQTTVVKNGKQYYDILSSTEKVIQNINFVNPDVVSITWIHREEFVEMPERVNVVLAAYTTAHARLKLYEVLESLGRRVLYADTDSIIYTVKPGEYEPELGDYLGQLTDELGGDFITHFVTGGPKNYAYKTSKPDADGKLAHCKVRGITLNYKNSMDINYALIVNMVKGMGPQKVTVTDNHKITRDKAMSSIVTKTVNKDYRVVFDKRVIIENFDTLPYGFNA